MFSSLSVICHADSPCSHKFMEACSKLYRTDSGRSRIFAWGLPFEALGYDFVKFSQKLHEIEKKKVTSSGSRPLDLPLSGVIQTGNWSVSSTCTQVHDQKCSAAYQQVSRCPNRVTYRSGTFNSKSFVSKVLLQNK